MKFVEYTRDWYALTCTYISTPKSDFEAEHIRTSVGNSEFRCHLRSSVSFYLQPFLPAEQATHPQLDDAGAAVQEKEGPTRELRHKHVQAIREV